jgi:hypothetical protein
MLRRRGACSRAAPVRHSPRHRQSAAHAPRSHEPASGGWPAGARAEPRIVCRAAMASPITGFSLLGAARRAGSISAKTMPAIRRGLWLVSRTTSTPVPAAAQPYVTSIGGTARVPAREIETHRVKVNAIQSLPRCSPPRYVCGLTFDVKPPRTPRTGCILRGLTSTPLLAYRTRWAVTPADIHGPALSAADATAIGSRLARRRGRRQPAASPPTRSRLGAPGSPPAAWRPLVQRRLRWHPGDCPGAALWPARMVCHLKRHARNFSYRPGVGL